jgi:hypothetical protein
MVYHDDVDFPNDRRHRRRRRWNWLLVVPVTVPLATPLYTRVEPRLGGVPFFFWCQLAFIALAVAVIAVVHRMTRP